MLNKIQHILNSNAMLQPNRLEELLRQALCYQVQMCKYHNTYTQSYSLLSNHQCRQDALPTKCIATLPRHKDQVWLVRFSRKGDKFASLCKDGTICIWGLSHSASFEVKCLTEIGTKA